MVRVVMFDLGGTLVNAANRPFAHVEQALRAIMSMRTAKGKPLATCLVSDFTLAAAPLTAKAIKPLLDQYLALLGATGLRPLFEPVARRVTLSTHAGVPKPARAVFEKALQRLRSNATLAECLLITENAAHVAAARNKLGMQALRFKADGSSTFDFEDWSVAPALVAHRVGATAGNLLPAARARFAALGLDIETLEAASTHGDWRASGQRWHPVTLPGHAELGTFQVAVPVQLTVRFESDGTPRTQVPALDPDFIREASAFAASLADQGQIAAGAAKPPARGATHAIETGADGQRRLVRRGFSAA